MLNTLAKVALEQFSQLTRVFSHRRAVFPSYEAITLATKFAYAKVSLGKGIIIIITQHKLFLFELLRKYAIYLISWQMFYYWK